MQDTNSDSMQSKESYDAAAAQWRGDNRNDDDPGLYPTFPKSTKFIQNRLKQMIEEKVKKDPEHTADQVPLALDGALSAVNWVSKYLYDPEDRGRAAAGMPPGYVNNVKGKYAEELEYLRQFVIMKRDLSDEQIFVRLQGVDAALLAAVV